MYLQAVCCFTIIMAAKWLDVASYVHENHHPLSSRDTNSQYRCCRGNSYAGYDNFNRRQDYYPSYHKDKHEYHTRSSIHNNYHGDAYFRPNRRNYYDYKHPPKDHYVQRYYGPSHPGSKYIQNRVGFAFPESHNVKEGNGGYRPYVPNPDFRDQGHYKKYYGYDSYKNKHSGLEPYDQHEEKRKKYKPGLLQSVSVGNSGIIVASGPNGYKHIIHDLPPWAELNVTPERDNSDVRFPSNLDHRGGIEYAEPHRFSHGFNKRPPVFNHPYYMQGNPIYIEEQEPPNSIKDLYGNKNGPPKDIPDIVYQSDDYNQRKPSKPIDFQPSPPFYRYSEPDPLYHPSSSPIQTHPMTKLTDVPTTKPTPRSTPEISSKYPDSINAQLPPPTINTDTRVPYVAASEVTKNMPEKQYTAVTQATDSTDKKPIIKVLPTDASVQNSTTDTISRDIQKPDEMKVVLPTQLSFNNSTQKEGNKKSDNIKKSLLEMAVLPTQLYFHNSSLEKKSSVTKKDMSQSDEMKAFLSNMPAQDSSKDSSFNFAIKEEKPVPLNPTLVPFVEISTKTEIFLPTIITEKYPIQELEIKSQTEATLQSSKENAKTSHILQKTSNTSVYESQSENVSTNVNQEVNEDRNKKTLISMNENLPDEFSMQMEMMESQVIHTMSSEITTESTSLAKNETNDNSKSDHVDLKQIVENSNDKITLPVLIQSTTEKMTVTTIDNLFPETQLQEKNHVKNRVSTFLDQIHMLVNHARSLEFLHHDAETTAAPLEDSDW